MKRKKIFISGGAGFIGSNVAKFHYDKNDDVLVFDNLSRKGTDLNIDWLRTNCKGKGQFKFVNGDIRDLSKVKKYIKNSDIIYHLAAQVAVTTSLLDPVIDFEINARGTLNLLEAFRLDSPDAIFIYASTNKVYGGLDDLACVKKGGRYVFQSELLKKGISENRQLDFHSPYGCSKGAGDQYVRDYGRVYGLKTLVFRQSCIYGPRQFGNEDQGWVMHFVKNVVSKKRINIYGDGYQVRDLLHVNDLITAYQMAIKKVKRGQGIVYNIGGGFQNSTSLLNIVSILAKKTNVKIPTTFSKWREGDQKIYISDNTKINNDLEWKPRIGIEEGIDDLLIWAREILHK